MTKHFCDICKKRVYDDLNEVKFYKPEHRYSTADEEFEICGDCYELLLKKFKEIK